MVSQVIVETEKPGIVRVRAIASPDKQMDARPVAGFFVRRRYHGDIFAIAKWEEFSTRWMEFVDQPPQEWIEKIQAKYGEIPELARAEQEEPEPKTFSMGELAKQPTATMNYSTGQVIKRGPGRPRKNVEQVV